MEGVMKQWKEEEELEDEEAGLVKRQAHMHVTSTTVTTSKFDVQATEQTSGSSGLKNGLNGGQEFIQKEVNSGDTEKKTTFHPSDPVISVDSTFFSSVRTEGERVGIITGKLQLKKELYLESLYQKPPTQGFYCPNCKACIQKVLLLDTVQQETSDPEQPPPPPDPIRCSSCFSFLIPIGSWLFPGWVQDIEVSPIQGVQQPTSHSKGTGKLNDERSEVTAKIPVQAPETTQITVQAPRTPQITGQAPDQVNIATDSGKIISQAEQVKNDGADKASNEDHKTSDSPNLPSEITGNEHVQDGSKSKHSRWGILFGTSALATQKTDNIDIPEKLEQPPQLEVKVDKGSTEHPPRTTITATTQTGALVQESGSSREILKSIVYGGLVESIASLGIVTSSASSDATTLNILVLSLANLIGGLFILVHNIWDLKSEQPRTNNETNARADRYYQVLGKRENFYLHVFIAILSFIIFGLVPPVVYAFTFSESNNKDLKLAAVAGASAICITLLSIAKAYIQRPNTYLTYLKTVLQYLSTGAMTSVVSYLAGELVKELIEKLGWFNTKSSSFTLLLPEMSVDKPRFGSY